MCFVWIWEQTAIISLYSIDWLVFITETEFVYCAVRAEYLYTIPANIILKKSSYCSQNFCLEDRRQKDAHAENYSQ